MKKAAIVFLLHLALVFSLNDQAYLNGFAGQLGLTQEQTTANINCFNPATTEINDMRAKIAANPLTIDDNTIYDWVQQIKYILMRKCPIFESDTKSYFVQNTKASVLSEAPCNSMSSYNNQIKQSLLAWSFDLSSGQDEEAGKMHAYIYQILFGVVNPLVEPVASFTYTLSGLTFSFDAGASMDPDGSIVDYSWDFGNPSGSSNTVSGTSSTVSHTYATPGTYTVTLKVTDNNGNSATTTSIAKINVAPTASFIYSISGTTITFDASGSVDSDGTIATYAWNFGESGSPSNSVSVTTSSISHIYASYGTYTIILTVIDNDGATATQTQTIKINSPPTVSLMTSVMKRTVSFDSSASTDSDGGIVSYAWNFGEPSSSSNTASTVTATHTYSGPGTFTVTLVATDTDGTAVTKTKSITVLANQAPTATFTPTLSVLSKTVTFNAGSSTDSDGSIVNYSWNFGESSSSSNVASGSTTTATHTYTSTGTYTVTLTVTDDEGATTTVSKSVKINAAPVASFTYSMSRRTVTFDASTSTDLDGGIVKYDWNFGEPSSDKNIASKAAPGSGHIYAAAGGTFTVTLTVTDSDGATTTITKSVTVAADIAPTASFTFSVSGKAVSFNAGASTDSDGNIVTYAWNFGESGSSSNTVSSTSSTASHTYLSPGTYTVVLTVTDNEGTTNSLSKAVKINAPPTGSFTYTISGKTVAFDASGSTDSDGSITNYKWNFGETSSSSNIVSGSVSSASHTYASYGTYTVTLTVTDNDGAPTSITKSVKINAPPTASFTASINKRVVSFDASASTDSDGSIASYTWNFGESSSSSNTASGAFQTPTHTYSSAGGPFAVTLTVTDNNGATTTTSKSITIAANIGPTASFTYTITGNTIAYNAGASADSDGSISNYAWTFGESSSYTNTASGASSTTSHTYASPGTYTVVLTVTDNEGAITTQTKSIKINTPPTASFTYSINKRVATFNGGASTDSDGTITAYSWNFGESSSSSNAATGSTSTHTYAPAGGSFTVTLAVTDNDGATTTTTQSITITADIAPTASFTYTITGNTIAYNAGGSTDSDGSIVTYAWDFGEPSSSSNTASSSTSSVSHTYATPRTYTVTLTVTDNEGVTSTQTKSIRINAPPTASFTYSITRRVVTFNAGASIDSDGSITAYSWNFGESSSSSNTASGSTATHTYAPAGGTFTVTLIVTDNDGATTTTTQSFTIAANIAPTASFTQTLSSFTISFNAGASTDSDGNIVTYAWNFGESSSSSNTASGTSLTASHTYASYGTYTITLTVTDNEGATNVFSKSVKINAPPTASFTQTISGTTITFNAALSTDSDGTIANYAWTFGESSSSSNTASSSTSGASHTYATYGTYTVILTVTDSDGATNSITKSIRINAPPTASFTYSINRRVVTFNAGASTDSDGSITAYSWNFGESSSSSNTASGSTATHTYAPAGGSFTVTLTVTDNDGATSTTTRSFTIAANVAPTASFTQTLSSFTISFNAGASTDSDGSIVTYAWNFGESSSSSNTASGTSTTASHAYASYGTYTITLTVTDNEGATNAFSKSVKINAPPVASFTQTISGTTISFNAGGSTDSDGSIVTYAWTFGESSSSSNTASSSSSSASHAYATTGTYSVTLTVTDNDGATNSITRSIKINTLPTASFTYSISRRVVTFNAGASTDSDGSITAYSWNFGESSSSSNTASGSTSTHTYAPTGGSFTVTLTVTDNDGATSTTTRSFTIAANIAPTASIVYTTSVGGNQISFDASGSTDSDGTIVNYSWNFGESGSSSNTASSSSSSALHVYSISGTYTVTLQITDNEGATATATKIIGVSSNCANQFHIIASWSMQGDYDIILKLPNGNYIGYWNKGPDSSTSYGKLIADSVTNENPEETCWQSPYIPPSGTYLICLNPYSGVFPSVVTVTVIKNSVATVYQKTATAQVRDQSCTTSSSSFVTSVTYP